MVLKLLLHIRNQLHPYKEHWSSELEVGHTRLAIVWNICTFNHPLLFWDLMNWIVFVALKAHICLWKWKNARLKPDYEENSVSSCRKTFPALQFSLTPGWICEYWSSTVFKDLLTHCRNSLPKLLRPIINFRASFYFFLIQGHSCHWLPWW